MNAAKLRLAGYLTLGTAVAVGGGYAWGRGVHEPPLVAVGSTACGVPTSSARFDVPLAAILRAAGGLSFAYGPLEVPEGGRPVRLRFEPPVDGQARDLRQIGDTLYLPTGFGHDRRLPTRITLHCREGVIGSVRYHDGRRESATFNVMRAGAAALAGEAAGARATEPPPVPRVE